MAARLSVKFLYHAEKRIEERSLDRKKIEKLCRAAAPMLRVGVGQRFRIYDQVIVAQRQPGNIVEVITAWEQPPRPKT